ncbi:energy-coupling factor ABC transporter ATP-binding protein [Roseateles terrae]|uniref:ABC transporter ATP-binding protein n=1 Tax=Roseateles terrae TaxID=431060 RepID=A0ABR6GTS2_9BURK|nr:ABC transporter ATP-binding protein [Roseateles terrae]MBB3195491.1 cobalt/nickel transport system ATP-binding protein [Roseateles terrae]OWQ86415.1 cobalt ABC transporter ATP-binding protein [Roseateles terrae]
MTPLIELRSASYCYPDGSQGLHDCSLALRAGSRNALLGANGAGKTTLMQHLNGLLQPDQGGLHWQGQPVRYSRDGLRRLRQQVGLVFQNPDRQLFSAHVEEDVSFGPLNLGLPEAEVRQRVAESLAAVGMSVHARSPVHHLSFGQKKRVCLAGVLAMRPQLLVLDEPMAGLDLPMQKDLQRLLDGLVAQGVTVLVSTHDAAFAADWADEIHVMAQGRCQLSRPVDALLTQPQAWLDVGQSPPEVMALHAELVRQGVLPAVPVPRSIERLLAALRAPRPVTASESVIHEH